MAHSLIFKLLQAFSIFSIQYTPKVQKVSTKISSRQEEQNRSLQLPKKIYSAQNRNSNIEVLQKVARDKNIIQNLAIFSSFYKISRRIFAVALTLRLFF